MIEINKKEQTPSQEEVDSFVSSVYNFAGDLIVNQNYSYDKAKEALVQHGINEEDAKIVLDNIKHQIKEAKSNAADKELLFGFLWAAGGAILTFLTNGTLIFYGAVIYGLIQLSVGMWHKIS